MLVYVDTDKSFRTELLRPLDSFLSEVKLNRGEMLDCRIGYWNYAVDGQSMFILFRCRQIYNDMRLDCQRVIQQLQGKDTGYS